jgi:sulfur-oxidizing protein SoxX
MTPKNGDRPRFSGNPGQTTFFRKSGSVPVFLSLCVLHGAVAFGVAAQTPVFSGDAVPAPLTATPGDAARGKKVVVERDKGHCILCHALPEADVRFAGNVGPPLAGVATRLSAAQIRGRIADPSRHDPQSAMPAYFRTEGLRRVAKVYEGKTVLSAQDVEDAVAYLASLR